MLTQLEWFHRMQARGQVKKSELKQPVARLARFPMETSPPKSKNPPDSPDGFHTSPLQWSIASNLQEMEALETEWRALEANMLSAANVFLTYDWNHHWAKAFLTSHERSHNILQIFVGRRAGKIVSIWPLQGKNFMGSCHLHWMGDPVSQYGDILVRRGEDLEAILLQGWKYICEKTDVSLFVLRKVREDAAIMGLIQMLKGTQTCDDIAMSIHLPTMPTFDAYMERFSKKEKKNRRRLRNRLAHRGPLRFEVITFGRENETGSSHAKNLVQEAIDLKRGWLAQNTMVSKAFANPRLDVFFENIFQDTQARLGGQIAALYCGEKIAAMMVGFLYQGHFHAHISVVNPEFSADRPGIALMEDFIAWHYAQETRTFDLMAPAAPYKKLWTNRQHMMGDYTLCVRKSGTLYTHIMLRGVRQTGKRLAAHLPDGLKEKVYDTAKRMLWK